MIPFGRVQMATGIGRRDFVAQQANMTIRRLLWLSAATLSEIERMQAHLDARLEAAASTGPSLPEGSNALLHRQPTPNSMAAAEVAHGKISPEKAKVVRAAMARARKADQAGDKATCEQALAEVQRTIGP